MKSRSIVASVLRIVLPYLALGAAWILFSDRLLLNLIDKPQALLELSTAKGWLYVLITGSLLFALVYGELRRRAVLESKLREGIVEKETLLSELNHRVKNNLQVIASILNLEGESLAGEEARALSHYPGSRPMAQSARLLPGKRFAFEVEDARDDLQVVLHSMVELGEQGFLLDNTFSKLRLEHRAPAQFPVDQGEKKRARDQDVQPTLGRRELEEGLRLID